MDLGVFDYTLDPALIAQQPLSTRDGSRMLVVERATGSYAHATVQALGDWLNAGDVLVVNDAEVITARLHGTRPTGGAIEVLLIEPIADTATWQCIARGAGRIPAGESISFGHGLAGTWGERLDGTYRLIHLRSDDGDLDRALQRVGELPLPPYIRRPDGPSPLDYERYQTMFARRAGAIAAPTAGLHFTPRLVASLQERGVECVPLTLMVGPATFLPIRTMSLAEHSVPAERYEIPASTATAIANARAAGRRIVAVGTTTVRASKRGRSRRRYPTGRRSHGPRDRPRAPVPGGRCDAHQLPLAALEPPRARGRVCRHRHDPHAPIERPRRRATASTATATPC